MALSSPIDAFKRWRENAKQHSANNVVPFPGTQVSTTTANTDDLIGQTMVEASQLTDLYEGPLDKTWHGIYAATAYLLPTIAAIAAGWWIGDGYAGSFRMNGPSAGVHIISLGGEIALVMLTLTSARTIKRAASDRVMWRYLAVIIGALIVFSLASALAQWFLIQTDIKAAGYDPSSSGVTAMLLFRVIMPVGIDIAALLYLSIHGHRSLKNRLAQLDERGEAFEKLHMRKLSMQAREDKARQEREDIEADRARRRKEEETLNHIREMQTQAAIAAMEKALNPQIIDSTNNRTIRR